jgi:hypothetical protein
LVTSNSNAPVVASVYVGAEKPQMFRANLLAI